MTKRNQIYKCEICGNIIEVLHEGTGQLVCCGEPMKLLEENTVDVALEKHVPVIEFIGENKSKVKIGSIEHLMEQTHYIEWIEAVSESGTTCKKFLKPGDKPEAEFSFKVISAREYCNIHGLWKT